MSANAPGGIACDFCCATRLLEAVVAVQVHSLDAAHRANRFQRPVRHAQRIAAQGVAVLAFDRHGGTRECGGHCLVDRGECRLTVGTLLERNDDDDRGVSILGTGLRARSALAVLRGQRRVGVDRRRGRGSRYGLGRVVARVGLLSSSRPRARTCPLRPGKRLVSSWTALPYVRRGYEATPSHVAASNIQQRPPTLLRSCAHADTRGRMRRGPGALAVNVPGPRPRESANQ